MDLLDNLTDHTGIFKKRHGPYEKFSNASAGHTGISEKKPAGHTGISEKSSRVTLDYRGNPRRPHGNLLRNLAASQAQGPQIQGFMGSPWTSPGPTSIRESLEGFLITTSQRWNLEMQNVIATQGGKHIFTSRLEVSSSQQLSDGDVKCNT